LPNGDASGTRAAKTSIDAKDVAGLEVAWRFHIPVAAQESGAVTATPLVAGGTVYVQDMESDVFALDAKTGAVEWRRLFHDGTPGPNGLALAGDTLVGSTDTTVFALDAHSGTVRWTNRILGRHDSFVDVAPLVAGGLVYTGTTGYSPGTRGLIVALELKTGRVRWRFDTIRAPWAHPSIAGGGGIWETPTIAGDTLYAGIANPLPWGGTRAFPNGAALGGAALYTDALVALDAKTGALRWFDQVTPRDIRDHDLQNPPVLTKGLIVGSGKSGLVVAWDRSSHRRVWTASVGSHRNDSGPLPRHTVSVCPGLLGGVETPLAVANGRVFAPVVDLCYGESATGAAAITFQHTDPATGRGEVVALDLASGRRDWDRTLSSPPFGCATAANDLVFVPTYDGRVLALSAVDGRTVWSARAPARINACPSVAGDTLYVAAGAPPGRFEVVAYRLPTAS
jgi:alcohol dehydrogenase (cytochrome c)